MEERFCARRCRFRLLTEGLAEFLPLAYPRLNLRCLRMGFRPPPSSNSPRRHPRRHPNLSTVTVHTTLVYLVHYWCTGALRCDDRTVNFAPYSALGAVSTFSTNKPKERNRIRMGKTSLNFLLFLAPFLGPHKSEWLLLPKRAAALWEGNQCCC